VTTSSTLRWLTLPAALLTLIIIGACQQRDPSSSSDTPVPEYRPSATIRELMHSIVDPTADVVWLSVGTVMDENGVHDIRPSTDEEWEHVRNGAITLLESANLLMMPGRAVAHPGEDSLAPGIELTPEEIAQLIDANPRSWNARSLVMHQLVTSMVEAIDAKDADTLFTLGSQLQAVCESCHREYWYPNEVVPPLPSS